MQEPDIRRLMAEVAAGRRSRRQFLQRMAACGIAGPMAGLLLMDAGIAQTTPAFSYKPTKRGGGGTLRLLEWQAPTLLNPHFATGLKDNTGSRIYYESLGWWDADANLQPQLAASIPNKADGSISADNRTITWKLKRGVTWHDGQPFTADDVIFNWQYATDPATATVTIGEFRGLKLEKVDSHTVRVVFDKPSPFWPGLYATTMLVPRHVFAPYIGARSREAPANLKPVGTGPYRHVDFRPGDLLVAELNPNYHRPNRPYFDRLEMKGGGDATGAARAVLQTGEYEYAGSLVMEEDILKRMEAGGKGRVVLTTGNSTMAVYLNTTDPAVTVDGERSHVSTRHPQFSDPAVRRAMGLLLDREGLQRFLFGRQATATANWINQPPALRSPNTRFEFSIDRARKLLDDAGWKPGADGVRAKDGKRLALLFQGATGGVTSRLQATYKGAAEKAGIALELKTVPSSVFFSSDIGNPDNVSKFIADLQVFNWTSNPPDPTDMLKCFVSWEAAAKANKWQGQNNARWRNADYDQAFRAFENELDPVKRAALVIRMNDLVVGDGYIIPCFARSTMRVLGNKLQAPFSAWANDMTQLADWYRDT